MPISHPPFIPPHAGYPLAHIKRASEPNCCRLWVFKSQFIIRPPQPISCRLGFEVTLSPSESRGAGALPGRLLRVPLFCYPRPAAVCWSRDPSFVTLERSWQGRVYCPGDVLG